VTVATEYRIDYTVVRRDDKGNYKEIGFGSSGEWATPSECVHMVDSDVENYGWSTSKGMPDPMAIKADVEAAR
jgi:hypothetical protein